MHAKMTHLVVSAALAIASSACIDEQRGERRDDPPRKRPTLEQIQKAPEKSEPSWADAFTYAARWDAERKAVVVDVAVSPGFHAYTEGESVGKPLLLTVSPASALQLSGPVQYPKGTVKELPIGKSVIVEGKAEIVGPVADPAPGKAVAAALRYQVCTPEACDRPRTVDLSVNVP